MDDSNYCEFHDSYWNDDYACECHFLRAEDRKADYEIELWKERLRD